MSLNDPLANALSSILSDEKTGRGESKLKPSSKIIKKVLEVMKNNNYIGDFEENFYEANSRDIAEALNYIFEDLGLSDSIEARGSGRDSHLLILYYYDGADEKVRQFTVRYTGSEDLKEEFKTLEVVLDYILNMRSELRAQKTDITQIDDNDPFKNVTKSTVGLTTSHSFCYLPSFLSSFQFIPSVSIGTGLYYSIFIIFSSNKKK